MSQPLECTATTNASTVEEEFYLESVSRYKCRKCKQPLVDRTVGTGRLANHIVLMTIRYCRQHGQAPVTERRQQISKLVKDVQPLFKPSITTSTG